MSTKFTPNPVLIEAAKHARDYLAVHTGDPWNAWVCDAISALYLTNRDEQAKALEDAVNAVLGDEWSFLPSALYWKDIGPFAGASEPPQGEGCRTVRLWWLRQIIEGKPVPGAD